MLEDIVKERSSVPICSHREIGSDPELDEFMVIIEADYIYK